jgi:chromosome segregation ATPase
MAIGPDRGRVPQAPPPTPRPGAPAANEDQLGDRLRAIVESVTSPEDALDPMVRAVMESMNACAGAVCLFDTHERMLRLAAESGLSDQGCRRLRSVREGDVDAWEMPLHGLVNGRAYLIENAYRNRFVPHLIDDPNEMSAVVCLPLSTREVPLASLILVARMPHTFDERRIHAVEGPLQEMARVIEAIRRHAEERSRLTASLPPPPPASASPPRPAEGRTSDPNVAARLAQAERERDRLAAALETARTDDAKRATELRAELDRLRAQLGEAQAGAAHERRAREELESRFAGGASAGRHELQRAQEAFQEAESARASAVAETTRLRAEIEVARMEAAHRPVASTEVSAQTTELLAQIDQLRASLAQAEAGAAHEQRAREELEGRLAGGTTAGQQELHQAVSAARAAEQARAAAIAEVARLRNELELAHIEAMPGPSGPGQRDDRIGPLLAEIDRLRARLAEAEAGAAHEHRARDELETRFTRGVESGQQELRHAREAARRAEEARATTLAEMERLRNELERARSDAARAPVATGEVDTRIVELATEIDRLRTRLAEAEAGAAHQHRAREELEIRFAGDGSTGQQELRKALERARQAEQARADVTAEIMRLRTELESARRAAAQAPEDAEESAARTAAQMEELDRLHARLAEAEAGAAYEHRAREELELRFAQAATAAHEDLERARVATQAAEEARTAVEAETARLGAELREARVEAARLPALKSDAEARAADLVHELERLTARLADAEALAGEERRAREAVETRLAADVASERQAREAAIADIRDSAAAAAQAEIARLGQDLATARGEAARVEALTARLAEAEHAGSELTDALETAAAERAELARTAAETAAARSAELEQLRARLAEAEASAAREQRAREALTAAAEHDLGTQENDLRNALDAARAAEEARDQATAEIAVARGERTGLLARLADLENEITLRQAEKSQLADEAHEAWEARDERERALAVARRDGEETAAQLAEVERLLASVRGEYDGEREASTARIERAEREASRLHEAHADAAAARDRLAAELAESSAARTRFEEGLARAVEQATAQERALAATREHAADTASRLAQREADLQALREARTAEVTSLGARCEDLTGELQSLRDVHAAVGAERDRLAAELEGTAAAKAHLEGSLQSAIETSRAREQAAADRAQELAAQLAERDGELRALAEERAAGLGERDARLHALDEEADDLRERVAALGSERDRLAADLQGAAAGKGHLEQALEQALEEGRGSARALRDARGQGLALSTRLAEVETAYAAFREDHASETTALNGRVETLNNVIDQLREANTSARATCDRLAADLEGAAAAKAHLDETLQAALEEARTRDQGSMEDLETTRDQAWVTASRLAEIEQRLVALGEERAAEAADFASWLETLQSEGDRWRDRAATAETERDRLAADLEGAAAAKAHLDETLKNVLETARAREQDTTTLLHEVRGQAWATAVRLGEREVTLRAVVEERAAETAAAGARMQALTAETDRLRETESAASTERDHLAAELAGTRAAHERLEQALAQTLAESRERDETATARLTELEREIETLRAAERSAPAKPAAETAGPAKDAPKPAPAARAAAKPVPLRPPAPAAAAPLSETDVVAVLDEEGTWADVAVEQRTMVLALDADPVTRLAAEQPKIAVVNLAAMGALNVLVALRALGARTRIYGYLAKAGSDSVLPLAAIEPAARPLDPDAIVATLGSHMPAHARVVTVGTDVDAMLSLRQALGRHGASVSLAWDTKQATDLLDMIHPHVVVTDLEMARDACIVLARVAMCDPVPTMVLIESTGSGADLTPVLSNPEVTPHLVSRKDFLATLVSRKAGVQPKAATPPTRSAAR